MRSRAANTSLSSSIYNTRSAVIFFNNSPLNAVILPFARLAAALIGAGFAKHKK
jgi:hypothetical protein